ncbi:MAG: hypothetical protein IJ774_13025 [Selenomonadaceae bacterium]|nr:hypothetical protein [Selenomonadaceae bacterium]
MATHDSELIDAENLDILKPQQEKFSDICCEDCKFSLWNAQKNLFWCTWYGIFVTGDDSCYEAEN